MGAAGCRQSVLKHLVPDTLDYDIRNCMFTIVVQLIDMLQLEKFGDPTIDSVLEFKSWRACSSDRSSAIKHIADKIGMTAAEQLNLAVANGARIPEE